mgnify:FL=1
MAASHQDATGASLLARIMYWWNGTNAVPVDTSNPLPAGGNVASGATDAGNPLKVGGKYNSTKPTLTNGQRGDVQLTSRGSVAVTLFGADSATSVSFDGITSVAKIDIAAGTTNATSVKASPGRVLGVECKVVRASDVFLKIFNVTGVPVPGTTAVRDQIRLPLSSNVNLTFGDGIYCSTGIGIALTTGVAESDTGALTAGDVTFFRIRYA